MLWRKRRRAAPDAFPPSWRQLVESRVPQWAQLDGAERAELESTALWLVASKRWEAAKGFELTDDVPVTIAGHAALLVLGLGRDPYRAVSAIIVHPSTVTLHGPRAGPVAGTVTEGPMPILGQATDERGPILISWDAVLANGAHPELGMNVVHHEFAHKIDMLDGYADGVPPLADAAARARWDTVCGASFEALSSGRSHAVLRSYGATNMAEFFAVATEAFLNRPIDLAENEADLYGLLVDFYRQDPAARAQGRPPSKW